MRWASSGVPVHLVPLSFQPHAPLSRLVLLSCLHSFVLCAHTCTLALTLALRLPSGRRVCVCAPCSHRDSFELFFVLSRGAMNTLEGIAQRRPFHRVVIFLRDASGTYLNLGGSLCLRWNQTAMLRKCHQDSHSSPYLRTFLNQMVRAIRFMLGKVCGFCILLRPVRILKIDNPKLHGHEARLAWFPQM